MGSVGRHLYNVIDRNRFAGDLIINQGTLHRLNPYFASVNYGDNSGSSSYNGATVSVRRIFGNGISFQTSYTFGKAIDFINAPGAGSGSVYAPVIDAYNVNRQRGLSDNDVRHKLAFNFVVALPRLQDAPSLVRQTIGGWELSSLAVLQSGLPFTVHTDAPFQPVWNLPSCADNVTPAAGWSGIPAVISTLTGTIGMCRTRPPSARARAKPVGFHTRSFHDVRLPDTAGGAGGRPRKKRLSRPRTGTGGSLASEEFPYSVVRARRRPSAVPRRDVQPVQSREPERIRCQPGQRNFWSGHIDVYAEIGSVRGQDRILALRVIASVLVIGAALAAADPPDYVKRYASSNSSAGRRR